MDVCVLVCWRGGTGDQYAGGGVAVAGGGAAGGVQQRGDVADERVASGEYGGTGVGGIDGGGAGAAGVCVRGGRGDDSDFYRLSVGDEAAADDAPGGVGDVAEFVGGVPVCLGHENHSG